MRNFLKVAFVFVVLLCAITTLAQSTGEVAGTITDSSGAVIPNAALRLVNNATNVSLSGATNDEGAYRFGGLQPGAYVLVVTQAGFAETRLNGVTVEVNRITRADAVLQAAGAEASVNIQAGAQLLDLETGTKGTTIPIKQMRDLPLATRNPLSLMLLTPGVVTPTSTGGNSGTGNRQGSDGTAASITYAINGGRYRGTGGFQEYVVDGISVTSQRDGVIVALPAADALQEFRVQSGGMSAEFGRTVGGVVSYVSDTGTNAFHGNLFESVRNTVLNARRAIPAVGAKPATRFNQFGGTVGGPVYLPRFGEGGRSYYDGRNRTFFFVGYEGSRLIRTNPTVTTVPTVKMREGDFSEISQIIYDPASNAVAANRTAFPGNIIPAARINPIGQQIINRFPLPNLPGVANNYAGNFRAYTPVDNYTARLDQTINEQHRLFFRYTRVGSINDAIFNLGDSDGQTVKNNIPQRGYVANYNYTITPTLLYSAAVGYIRFERQQDDPSGNTDGASYFGYSITPTPRQAVNVRPLITSDIYRPLGTRDIFDQLAENYQLNQNLTWTRGTHTFRFGGDLRRYIAGGQLATGAVNGTFAFGVAQTGRGTANTGYSAASMLLGLPAGASFAQPPRLRAFKNVSSVYAQDDWRITPNLIVNLGLRFDLEGPLRERNNQLGYLDTKSINPLVNLPGVFRYSTADDPDVIKPDYNNVSPRVGFAWALGKERRTSLRGAFGVYSAPIPTVGYYSTGLGLEPFLNFVAVNAQSPAVVLRDSFTLNPAGGPLGDAAYLGQGITQPINRDLRNPRVYQWNFGVQREIVRNTVAELLYTGNRGQSLLSARNLNLPSQSLIEQAIALTASTANPAAAATFLNTQVTNPLAGKVPGTLGNATVTRAQASTPFPQFAGINAYFNDRDSIYHALQATLQRRLTGDLSFTAAYTFSKLIENAETAYQNPFDTRDGRAVSPYDRPHIFTGSFSYRLPFGRGKRFANDGVLNAVLGGFQLTGILNAYSGTPLAITQSAANGLGVGSSRPDVLGDPIAISQSIRGQVAANGNVLWIDPKAYVLVNGRYGSAPVRDGRLRDPRFVQFDLGLQRDFRFTERVFLRFRAEAFNALNHTNLAGPDTNLNSPTFGQISSVQDPRIFQLGLELRY